MLMLGGGESATSVFLFVDVSVCGEELSCWRLFFKDKTHFSVTTNANVTEARRANAKMQEEVQEESVCLLKIQRGRTDIVALSDDLWQRRG